MKNSLYTLDPLSFVFGHVTDPNSTDGKTYSPVIGLFFNSFVQHPYRGQGGGWGALWLHGGQLLAVQRRAWVLGPGFFNSLRNPEMFHRRAPQHSV